MKKIRTQVPNFDELLIPTLKALKQLGGSGSIGEINDKVYEVADISEDVLSILHTKEGTGSEIDYRISWARTYLKKFGLINNSIRGVWALIDNDINPDSFNSDEIKENVRAQNNPHRKEDNTLETIIDEEPDKLEWKEKLLTVLQNMDPFAFERLSQRILRESGFIHVEVTKKSGDGGIDGKGIVRINGFLSFHVFFQCKRFKDSVASSYIRDFRGAMQGRASKGLFITTGRFTRDAVMEASRDGAPPIDLIDGDLLCEKLKELNLGIETELIEEVTINPEWFDRI